MDENRLYSVALEFFAKDDAPEPPRIGRPVQAVFLNLLKQFDPVLSARLHDETGYRPFTLSPMREGRPVGKHLVMHGERSRPYYLRVTFFDSEAIWESLQKHFVEAGPIHVTLGASRLRLARILMTPTTDPFGWADSTDWNTLAMTAPVTTYTLHFTSPTAFSLGERQFGLFPEPRFVWGSLLRTWNRYAPTRYRIEKPCLQAFLLKHVGVTSCRLRTHILHFPSYDQKGFVGSCTYQIEEDSPEAANTASLTAFAPYAGIGYQTTMGMGQTTIQFTAPGIEECLVASSGFFEHHSSASNWMGGARSALMKGKKLYAI